MEKYNISIIVPIYNNGIVLRDRCFRSLKESSIFNKLEIILVDDCSSDINTKNIINKIDEDYQNVKTFFFTDRPSKSPSRPRNKGVELATSKYISFLDPDNQAINDGYAKLYKCIKEDNKCDLAIGNMEFINSKVNNYYKDFLKINNGRNTSTDGRSILLKTNFKSQSIQACLISKNLISDNNLKMIEGALGEDTLFFYELIINSNLIKVSNDIIHIYYNKDKNSLTNKISIDFYNQYYILEISKKEKLERYQLLDEYLVRRYEYYFKNWYIKKIRNIDEKEITLYKDILYKIYEIYKNDWNVKDEEIKQFLSI